MPYISAEYANGCEVVYFIFQLHVPLPKFASGLYTVIDLITAHAPISAQFK